MIVVKMYWENDSQIAYAIHFQLYNTHTQQLIWVTDYHTLNDSFSDVEEWQEPARYLAIEIRGKWLKRCSNFVEVPFLVAKCRKIRFDFKFKTLLAHACKPNETLDAPLKAPYEEMIRLLEPRQTNAEYFLSIKDAIDFIKIDE